MARNAITPEQYTRPVRRILLGCLIVFLIGLFLLWRIDNPRAERLRVAIVDAVVPQMDWALVPVTQATELVGRFQSYARLAEQNQELRRELQQMKAWREAALQLEQENAKLLDLNRVRLDPSLTYVTGVVLADSGSPFRQSVILNVGSRDGIVDGWATTDGLGLVGRISGVGKNSSRVLLLTDSASRVPVIVQPSGQRAFAVGDNRRLPILDFVEDPAAIRPGDRVVSSGDGGVFPADLLVGQVAIDTDGVQRVRLSADYERLEFLRVLRSHSQEAIDSEGGLIATPDPEPEPEQIDEVLAEELGDG